MPLIHSKGTDLWNRLSEFGFFQPGTRQFDCKATKKAPSYLPMSQIVNIGYVLSRLLAGSATPECTQDERQTNLQDKPMSINQLAFPSRPCHPVEKSS